MKESFRVRRSEPLCPESCAGGGNTAGVAWTGVHVGLSIELRKPQSGVPTNWLAGKAT